MPWLNLSLSRPRSRAPGRGASPITASDPLLAAKDPHPLRPLWPGGRQPASSVISCPLRMTTIGGLLNLLGLIGPRGAPVAAVSGEHVLARRRPPGQGGTSRLAKTTNVSGSDRHVGSRTRVNPSGRAISTAGSCGTCAGSSGASHARGRSSGGTRFRPSRPSRVGARSAKPARQPGHPAKAGGVLFDRPGDPPAIVVLDTAFSRLALGARFSRGIWTAISMPTISVRSRHILVAAIVAVWPASPPRGARDHGSRLLAVEQRSSHKDHRGASDLARGSPW
jgi:hypothetical protein